MLFDNATVLDPFTFNGGTPTSLVSVASANSANVYDITGLGSGVVAGTYVNYGQLAHPTAVFGADYGSGAYPDMPYLFVQIGTAFATNASLTIAIQASLDTAATGSPAGFVTIAQTGAIPVANLTANATFQLPLPVVPLTVLGGMPRFYRLLYTVNGSQATTGTVSSAIVLGPWTTFEGQDVQNNYVSWIG